MAVSDNTASDSEHTHPEVDLVLSYTRVSQLPEGPQRGLVRLAEHADQIVAMLEETKTQKPFASLAPFTRIIATKLVNPIKRRRETPDRISKSPLN
jgi:hypothetical protein